MTAPHQDSPAETGKITRRQFVKRIAVAGAAAAAASAAFSSAALAAPQAAPRFTIKAQSRPLTPTFYSWITNIHPDIPTINQEFSATTPLNMQIAPVQGFGIDRFVAEAKDKNSTWDVYVGMTPFVEMSSLIAADVIEPWDKYIPKDVLDDLIPSIRAECTVNGQLYSWPFLLDIIIMGWNGGQASQAGISSMPGTWDDLLASSQQVVSSGTAPYGVVFDAHGWRSLAPITHSISTQAYTPDLFFDFTSDPAVQALEVMKKMKDLS